MNNKSEFNTLGQLKNTLLRALSNYDIYCLEMLEFKEEGVFERKKFYNEKLLEQGDSKLNKSAIIVKLSEENWDRSNRLYINNDEIKDKLSITFKGITELWKKDSVMRMVMQRLNNNYKVIKSPFVEDVRLVEFRKKEN